LPIAKAGSRPTLRGPVLNLDSLNPEQRLAAVTHRGPVLILAGAGTGKTRVITHRIAHMVQKGVNPGNILAVTFTNKAAREMLERVNELVPKQPRSEDGEKPARPTICTFHSLCVRILREHIHHLGYKRNFVIYDEGDQLSAMRKILSAISEGGTKTDPRAVLTMLSKFKNGGTSAKGFEDPNVRSPSMLPSVTRPPCMPATRWTSTTLSCSRSGCSGNFPRH
jgi:superfamily I DNA/RNA helicase